MVYQGRVMFLYLTADEVGNGTGGGTVTLHESRALQEFAIERGEEFCLLSRKELTAGLDKYEDFGREPWMWDYSAYHKFGNRVKLCHVYAGTFSDSVHKMRMNGTRVAYTAAAHDIRISRQEHELLGVPFNYPHLTDADLWKRYVRGYLEADALVCPSTHSERVMRDFGATRPIQVIPHGVELPPEESVRPLPHTFTVGYLGAYGPDKGVRHLLRAWAELDYHDAILLLGGRDSLSPFVSNLIADSGASNVIRLGWVDDVADFYGRVSVYCQPSCSEGFGCEVLESLAHGRAVICSDGAGAADIIRSHPGAGSVYAADRPGDLTKAIALYRDNSALEYDEGSGARQCAASYTWDIVRERYKALWRTLL